MLAHEILVEAKKDIVIKGPFADGSYEFEGKKYTNKDALRADIDKRAKAANKKAADALNKKLKGMPKTLVKIGVAGPLVILSFFEALSRHVQQAGGVVDRAYIVEGWLTFGVMFVRSAYLSKLLIFQGGRFLLSSAGKLSFKAAMAGAFKAMAKSMSLVKWAKTIKDAGKVGAVASAAATAGSGGTAAPVTFWTFLGSAAVWVLGEILFFLGVSWLAGFIADWFFEDVENGISEMIENGETTELDEFTKLNALLGAIDAGTFDESTEDELDIYQRPEDPKFRNPDVRDPVPTFGNESIEESTLFEAENTIDPVKFLQHVAQKHGNNSVEKLLDNPKNPLKSGTIKKLKKRVLDKG